MMFPPEIIRIICRYNYRIESYRRIDKNWNQSLSDKEIQETHGLENTGQLKFVGMRTKSLQLFDRAPTQLTPNLKHLQIISNSNWSDIFNQPLNHLESLFVEDTIYSMNNLSNPQCLKQLILYNIRIPPERIPRISHMVNLETLTLDFRVFQGEIDAEELANCSNLKYLSLCHVNFTNDITWLAHLTKLEDLNISKCFGIGDSIAWLSSCIRLKSLSLSYLHINNVHGIHTLKQLKFLELSDLQHVNDITRVSHLHGLQEFTIRNLGENIDYTPITTLKKLKFINVYPIPPILKRFAKKKNIGIGQIARGHRHIVVEIS
jgi:hypothetical protein